MSGNLRNDHRDEVNDAANENDAANKINKKTTASKSLEYKANYLGAHQILIVD